MAATPRVVTEPVLADIKLLSEARWGQRRIGAVLGINKCTVMLAQKRHRIKPGGLYDVIEPKPVGRPRRAR